MTDKLFFEDININDIFERVLLFESWRIEKNIESSGDDNSIHKGAKAVVPGALILGRISAMISDILTDACMAVDVKMVFIRPLYADESSICKIKILEKKSRDKIGLVNFNVSLSNEINKETMTGTGRVWVPRCVSRIRSFGTELDNTKVFSPNSI